MKEIEVGIRLREEGLSFFGIEVVNGLINRGGKVVSIDGGGAALRKLNEHTENVTLALSGCDFRVFIDDSEMAHSAASLQHDQLFTDGNQLVKPYMRLVGQDPVPVDTDIARQEIETGIQQLRDAIAINPGNWSAYWIIGKGYQSISDTEQAFEAFQSAYQLQPGNVDVAREYMFECLKLGKSDEGILAALRATRVSPDNAGLVANLALAYLIGGQLGDAMEAIDDSLRLDPDDPISLNLKNAIQEVQVGERPQPSSFDDLTS